MDPTIKLNDELMIHVFSYVGGRLAKSAPSHTEGTTGAPAKQDDEVEYVEEEVTDEEAEKLQKKKKSEDEDADQFLDAMEAGKYYYALARVSRGWKRVIDEAIPHLASNICLSFATANHVGMYCMDWLGAHKLGLGRILGVGNSDLLANFSTPPGGPPPLIKLLRSCGTAHLKELIVFVYHGFQETQQPRQFLDEIAQRCPNLQNVSLVFYCRNEGMSSSDATLMSPSFYSLASIKSLRLSFAVPPPLLLDSTIVTKMIEGLPSLEYLFLDSLGLPTMGGDSSYTVFPIRSQSVKQVLVESFTKHVKLSLDCPKLEVFRCKGFMSHPSQPGQPPERIALQQQVVQASNVPESCLALVIHVCNPHGPPIGFPFHQLLGPNVTLLPLRNHHG